MRLWSLTIRCWFSMRHSNDAFLISRLLSDMLSCHFMLGSLFNSRHAWMIKRGNTLYFCGLNPIWQAEAQNRRPNNIECVHLMSWNSQIQNKRASKGFILIRHKRYQIYTCLQLSSSIASFVWTPAHFELQSYGGAWHNTKISFVEKYTLISWFLPILGV